MTSALNKAGKRPTKKGADQGEVTKEKAGKEEAAQGEAHMDNAVHEEAAKEKGGQAEGCKKGTT